MEEEEHEDAITNFPGLFTGEPNNKSLNESDYSASEKNIKKDILKKEKKKDISYSTLDGESSAEEMDLFDSKSTGKCKKTKSFKFLQKKDKDEKDDKKRKDEKDAKNKEKRKEKEFRKREKEEKRKSKKDKKKKFLQYDEENFPIFGVPLSLAVERCPSHDGIRLPAIVRQCIDFIEEKGLSCEGIYRTGGVKSKVQSIRRACNSGEGVELEDQHPHVVASLLKQYLRELPETVLTVDMMPHFEDVSLIPNPKERAEAMRQLIDRLPTTNRLLLQYVLKHMGNVIEKELENKMSYQNVCVVLSPTIQISHRVLNVMFHSHQYLFGNVVIKKYIPPITSCAADLRSIDELNSPKLIEEELNKQDSLLASLHAAVASGRVSRRTEEQLWEAQRNHTLLKRRLKMHDRRDSASNGGSESSQEKLNIQSESHGDAQDSSCEEREVVDSVEIKTAKELPVTYNEQVDMRTTIHISTTITSKSLKGKTDDNNGEPLSTHENKKKPIIEKNNSENSESATNRTASSASTVKDISIPVLPKPLSVRNTRNKMVQEEKELSSSHRDSLNFTKGYESLEKQDGNASLTKIDVPVSLPSENVCTISTRSSLPHNVASSSPTCSSNGQTFIPKNVEPNKIVLNVSNTNTHNNNERQPKKLYHSITHLKDPDSIIIMKEELRLQFEHEERLSMNQELTKKLKAEKSEISRLREEIQEMQTIYGYRTHSYDSSESDGTDSEGESDSEEDILTQISSLDLMNEKIQIENISLLKKIEEEREAVIHFRVALREAKFQQAQLRSQQVTHAVVAS